MSDLLTEEAVRQVVREELAAVLVEGENALALRQRSGLAPPSEDALIHAHRRRTAAKAQRLIPREPPAEGAL